MAQLATQSITLAGLQVAHATASGGGDVFTPDAHTILHVVNTGTGPVTVTVASQTRVLEEHAADVAVTVAAGAEASIGPFPHEFFASPSDGLAHVTYTDAAHTQIAAVGLSHAGVVLRGTIITASNAQPADLPSGSVLINSDGSTFATPSPSAPTVGQDVTTATSAPVDLPAGGLQFVHGASDTETTDVYFVPGVSKAYIFVVAGPPLDLGPNQIAVLLGPNGAATDLYVGGS